MLTSLVYGAIYLGVAVFVVATVVRAVGYAKLPIHLRWELYPVPHEEAHRARHGGSYFEEVDWWTRERPRNLMGELAVMVPEMLFLEALHRHNRQLWNRSFPFHFGLYLLIGAIGLVVVTALVALIAPSLAAGPLGSALAWLSRAVGAAGVILAVGGALGLLHRRLTDQRLKVYTTPGDLFNLLFFVVALGLIATGALVGGEGYPGVTGLATGLLTADTTVRIPTLLAAGLLLGALLVAYIPLTHMSHFVGKYFTYHAVRWDDAVNLKGSRLEATLAEYLTYRPTWSAPHMTADGTRTWAEVATTNPTEGTKR
jgi:nitrate reductase gamma subunit